MNAEHETPIEVPIRTDELGVPYIPLRPLPGFRSVAIELDPQFESLRIFPVPIDGQGEA